MDNNIEYNIRTRGDYYNFYKDYTLDNKIKKEYIKNTFIFKIYFMEENKIDELVLFDYYLISSTYCEECGFKLEIYIDDNIDDKMYKEIYFRLSTYAFFQENINQTGKIYYRGDVVNLKVSQLKGIRRLVPVLNVNKEILQILTKTIDKKLWESIKSIEENKITNKMNLEQMIYILCWRLLFGDVGRGNKCLTNIRIGLFKTEKFYEVIEGIPVIAVLIFSIMDYAFREDAVEKYKNLIKKAKNKHEFDREVLGKEDFLIELQYTQEYLKYSEYKRLSDEGYDNKTIWQNYNDEKIHPFVIKEMYEAISISESIIQLLENVINHAGKEEHDGKGLFSVYIRQTEKDREIINENYKDFSAKEKDNNFKYVLEIIIADLSGTNIPDKFKENNKMFIENNREQLENEIKNQGGNGIPELNLKSFFMPNDEETKFWAAFFSFPDKAINHYGLQIFDSIIDTKKGVFYVESGKYSYPYELGHNYNGSKYSIVCPLNAYSNSFTNIYDSMFSYDYIDSLNDKFENIDYFELNTISKTSCYGNKQLVINEISKIMADKDLFCIDMNAFYNTECVVKALLKHIFIFKNNDIEREIKIAILNCKTYQIINIVRIIAIYYNKQGENIKMRNVQIYIRGVNVGEEILFSGENLSVVKENIAKCACMRGTMYDNLQAVHRVLERGRRRVDDE